MPAGRSGGGFVALHLAFPWAHRPGIMHKRRTSLLRKAGLQNHWKSMAWTHQLDSQIGLCLPDMAVDDKSPDDTLDYVCIVAYYIYLSIFEIEYEAPRRLSCSAYKANALPGPPERKSISRRRTTGTAGCHPLEPAAHPFERCRRRPVPEGRTVAQGAGLGAGTWHGCRVGAADMEAPWRGLPGVEAGATEEQPAAAPAAIQSRRRPLAPNRGAVRRR